MVHLFPSEGRNRCEWQPGPGDSRIGEPEDQAFISGSAASYLLAKNNFWFGIWTIARVCDILKQTSVRKRGGQNDESYESVIRRRFVCPVDLYIADDLGFV